MEKYFYDVCVRNIFSKLPEGIKTNFIIKFININFSSAFCFFQKVYPKLLLKSNTVCKKVLTKRSKELVLKYIDKLGTFGIYEKGGRGKMKNALILCILNDV